MIRVSPLITARLALVLACALSLFGLVVWFQQRGGEAKATAPDDPFASLDLVDPECTWLVLRHAVETGGNERTRELAITWLDRQARRRQLLAAGQEASLLQYLEANGHAAWDAEYRFLFFNSAFNALHMGNRQEDLTKLLRKLALEAPEKTMRLYALQHIGAQRGLGHMTGPLAEDVRATLQALASRPDSPVAGTALSNLIVWDGPETSPDPQLVSLAIKYAEDPSCGVDVRVTAFQVARQAALPLARRLAPDTAAPVQVRKAAIACIGRHGEAADRASLQSIREENFRLAQAAEPALRALENRLTRPQAPAPIPF